MAACDTYNVRFSSMDQPCYKCGQLVVEGRPFCPHCLAPQIRVMVAEPVAASVPPIHETIHPDSVSLSASETVPILAVPMGWPRALKSCTLASVAALVLMLLGLNLVVATFSVGFLSVVFYRQGQPSPGLKPGIGLRLGALGGTICFGITAAFIAIAATVPDFRAKMHQQILENAGRWAGSHPGDPQIQAALDQLNTPEGFVTAMIVGGILMLVLSIVLGGLGGSLAAVTLGRRQRS